MVPKTSPKCSWARKARARPLASPPGANCSGGMSSAETVLLPRSSTLMINAADTSSRCAPRIRPAGLASVSSGSPSTSGITATPVSNPDRPSASFGKSSSDTAAIRAQLWCSAKSASFHRGRYSGWAMRWASPQPMTMTLRAM